MVLYVSLRRATRVEKMRRKTKECSDATPMLPTYVGVIDIICQIKIAGGLSTNKTQVSSELAENETINKK